MPTPRSPATDRRSVERKEAERLYLESKGNMKLVEIAEKLKLPDNKIRKWKSLDGWEAKLHPATGKNSKKKQVERSTSEKRSVPPKRGAPKGNINAKGASGNPSPKKPVKHGGYTPVFMDALDEDERELIDTVPEDEESLLLEQIQLFSIRERRILKAINKYREMNGEVTVADVSRYEDKRSFKDKEEEAEYDRRRKIKVDKGDILPGKSYNIQTHTTNKDMVIARLEQELSTVQSKKTKAIEALAKLHLENKKLDGDTTKNDIAKTWAEKVMKARGDSDG